MRSYLLTTIAAAALACSPAFAAEASDHKAEHGKEAEKVVAKWDPISGKAVDATIATEDVTVGKKVIVVGFASKEAAAQFAKADDKAKKHLAKAALRHHTVKDGKELDENGAEVKDEKHAKHEKKDK